MNKEEILKLQPTHIFALSTTKPILGGLNNSNIQILYFDFKTIKDIYAAIEKIGKTLKYKTATITSIIITSNNG